MVRVTPEDIEKFKELRAQRLSYGKIGNATGFSQTTVMYHLIPKSRERQKESKKISNLNSEDAEKLRKYRRDYMRKRYAENPEYRQWALDYQQEYQRRPESKAQQREYQRRPEVRERKRIRHMERLRNEPEYRKRINETARRSYRKREAVRKAKGEKRIILVGNNPHNSDSWYKG